MRMCNRAGVACVVFVALAVGLAGPVGGSGDLGDPYEILARYYQAVGGIERLEAQQPHSFEGKLDVAGLSGTVRHWSDGPGVNRTEVDLGVIQQTTGSDGETTWEVDSNGKLTIVRDEGALRERELATRMERFEHLERGSTVFSLSYEGREAVDGRECYVVKVANTLDESYRLFWIDADDNLLRWMSHFRDGRESRTSYGEYGEVGGVLRPFKETTSIVPTGQVQTLSVASYEVHESLPASLFKPPDDGPADFTFTDGGSSVEIPFRFIERHIFVPVTMDCTERLWVLDSGAGMSVIDAGYAAELGLSPEGKMKGLGAGSTVDVSFVTLPSFSLKGVAFAPQQAATIEIAELFRQTSDLEIAGILGFDFLSRFVTRIDYANELMTLYDPSSFEYEGGGVRLDAPLARNIFGVRATVDGRHDGIWTVDLGASGTSFHYPYASEHGFLDRDGVETVGFGAGGRLEGRLLRFESLALAGLAIDAPLIGVPTAELVGALGGRDRIGNLGNTVLRRFVLYLDYDRQQMIVEKGDDFEAQFPVDRSGLQLWRPSGGDVEVLSVAGGTPASEAGLLPGDVIGAVNGIDVRHLDLIALRELMRAEVGTRYTFDTERDGRAASVVLVLRDLL